MSPTYEPERAELVGSRRGSIGVPLTPPALLPGRSQLSYARVGLRALVVGVAAIAAMVVSGVFIGDATIRVPLVLVCVVAGVGAALIAGWSAFRASTRAKAEARAGYTTARGPGLVSARMYYELWQMDEDTGAVLRRPGERKASHPTGSR